MALSKPSEGSAKHRRLVAQERRRIKKQNKREEKQPAAKDGRVTKPLNSAQALSKETAKKAAKAYDNHELKSRKMTKKASSESDSEVDSEDESENESGSDNELQETAPVKANGSGAPTSLGASAGSETSEESASSDDSTDDASSEGSDSDGESGSEIEAPKTNGQSATTNGGAAVALSHAKESEDESSANESEDDSEDESQMQKGQPAKANGIAANARISKTHNSDEASGAESEDGSSVKSDNEASDEESVAGVKVNGTTQALANQQAVVASSKNESEDDSETSSGTSESDSSSSGEESAEDSAEDEDEEVETPAMKRKADVLETPVAKKTRTDVEGKEPSETLWVGQLSWNVDEEWLAREFESFGTVVYTKVVVDRESGRSKGFGFVKFSTLDDAIKAREEMHQAPIDGRNINTDYAPGFTTSTPREKSSDRRKSFGDVRNPPCDNLFAGNLSFDATEDDVVQAFSPYGTVLSVRMPTDQVTGTPKGYGYITFESVEQAQAAIDAMDGQPIAGRSCRLDFASRQGKANGDGGRGGFGNRGGFGGRGGARGGRGGRGDFRGGRGGSRGGRGGMSSTNRGGFGDFKGTKTTF